MGYVTCKDCGSENQDTARHCLHCGASLAGLTPIVTKDAAPIQSRPSDAPVAEQPKRRSSLARNIVGLLLLIALIWFVAPVGLYVVQPIGVIPDGITLVVTRNPFSQPFIDSPDGLCLRRTGGVSLICRMTALGQAPAENILLRLPYMHWVYLVSTGGQEFER